MNVNILQYDAIQPQQGLEKSDISSVCSVEWPCQCLNHLPHNLHLAGKLLRLHFHGLHQCLRDTRHGNAPNLGHWRPGPMKP